MKNFVFSLFILLTTTSLINAQVTINAEDMPEVGDSYLIVQAFETELADPELSSGANVYWNFSDLTAASDQLESYMSVGDVPIQFQFVFNNPNAESYANRAIAVEDFAVGAGIPVTDGHQFFLVSEDGFYDCGVAGSLSGFPVFGNREPTDRIFKLPLEYGMEPDSGYSFFEINIPELGYGMSHQTRENSLDAWGTIVTPEGSFEALRVRSVVNGVDTIVAEEFGINQVIVRPETIEYRWLSPGQGIPVMQVNTIDGLVTEVNYMSSDVTIDVPENIAVDEVTVFPNPARENFRVSIPQDVVIESAALVDMNGRTISKEFHQNGGEVKMDVQNESPGLYRVILVSEKSKVSGWVLIQP